MLFPFADKKAKKDKHKVGQKKQQKAKKGSDADSDVSHLGKMVIWIPRKWITCLTARPHQRVRLLKPSIPNIVIIIIITALIFFFFRHRHHLSS